MIELPFSGREEAGRLLGRELARQNLGAGKIVLALPRGGVPVGYEVAKELGAPLDVVVVRKLGVPWQPELAMGAVAGPSLRVLDDELIRGLHISQEEIDEITRRELAEIHRREQRYRAGRPAPALAGKTVILVDDGLATGSTIVVAARHVHAFKPRQIIIAAPVASEEAVQRLNGEADRCVCLATPEPFIAVGEWYRDFRQTSDLEVEALLAQNRAEAGIEPESVSNHSSS